MDMPVDGREGAPRVEDAVEQRQPEQDRQAGKQRTEQEERPEAIGQYGGMDAGSCPWNGHAAISLSRRTGSLQGPLAAARHGISGVYRQSAVHPAGRTNRALALCLGGGLFRKPDPSAGPMP